MKKFALIAIALLGFAFANAQVSNVKFPFGKSTILTSSNDSLTLSLTPKNTVEFVKVANTTLDTNLTVNLTTKYAEAGYILYLEVTADGTNRTLTFGTGMQGVALTVTASKTFLVTAIYDGSKYVVSTKTQVN